MAKFVVGGKDEGKIKGFLIYNEIEYPFSYEDGILDIYPKNKDVWLADNAALITSIGRKVESGRFINNICLLGQTATGKSIRFIVSERYSNINGFLSFNVYSFYIYSPEDIKMKHGIINGKRKYFSERRLNKIKGILIKGREIDYYYNSSNLFHSKYVQEDSQYRYNLSINGIKEKDCGNFLLDDNEVNIYIRSVATIHNAVSIPITSHSEMIVEFSNEVGLDTIEEFYFSILACLSYLCRRKNIEINTVEVFDYDDVKNRKTFGTYCFVLNRDVAEKHVNAINRIIDYKFIGDNFGKLLNLFLSDKMYINNLPKNIDGCRVYAPDRIIFNFVAFEREYSNLYPDTEIRSSEYLEVKKCVLEKMCEFIKNLTGKKKKYAKSFYKTIEHSGNSFGTRLQKALEDYEKPLIPFFIDSYGKEYKEEVENICERMNKMRNDSAHGNIDIKFSPEHILDFGILECLLYAMRLRDIGISDVNIQRAICQLMGYNIYIPNDDEL